jgi:hypothetical protein
VYSSECTSLLARCSSHDDVSGCYSAYFSKVRFITCDMLPHIYGLVQSSGGTYEHQFTVDNVCNINSVCH